MNTARDAQLLRFSLLVNVVLFGFIALASCAQPVSQRYDEITVERINIVEADGRTRMVISNRERAPDPILNGQPVPRQGGNAPGIIFFNDEGDERGGLVYVNNNASLTFDKYKQGEFIQLAYSESAEGSHGGLAVLDRPNQPPTPQEMERMMAQEREIRALAPEERDAAISRLMDEAAGRGETLGGSVRVFAGKLPDRTAVVMLGDAVGRTRLRFSVPPTGDASIEFLDSSGKVVQRLSAGK